MREPGRWMLPAQTRRREEWPGRHTRPSRHARRSCLKQRMKGRSGFTEGSQAGRTARCGPDGSLSEVLTADRRGPPALRGDRVQREASSDGASGEWRIMKSGPPGDVPQGHCENVRQDRDTHRVSGCAIMTLQAKSTCTASEKRTSADPRCSVETVCDSFYFAAIEGSRKGFSGVWTALLLAAIAASPSRSRRVSRRFTRSGVSRSPSAAPAAVLREKKRGTLVLAVVDTITMALAAALPAVDIVLAALAVASGHPVVTAAALARCTRPCVRSVARRRKSPSSRATTSRFTAVNASRIAARRLLATAAAEAATSNVFRLRA